MATNSALEEWEQLVKVEEEEVAEEEEEEEEEALSLCDLPVTLMQEKPRKQETQFSGGKGEKEDDFDFNYSFGGLFSEEAEMCSADEVFFQGQILPLRHSISSDPSCLSLSSSSSSTKGFKIHNNIANNKKQFSRCGSRSESMDRGSMSEFRSNSSSRSSSLRSQNSSSSTSSSVSMTRTPRVVSKPKIRNQFHTIPSPKPQLRQSSQGMLGLGNQQGRKSSSAWEFFRLGVVPAPEIGLQDLKVRNSGNNNRNCVSRNSSSSSNSSSCKSGVKRMSNKGGSHDGDKSNNHVLKQLVGKGGGLLSGCSCSVDTVMIKGGSSNYKSSNKSIESNATHAMKEKVIVAELKKNHNNNINNNRHQKQAKKVMSRRRTFEWLKDLHASHPDDEEALLLNT